MKRLVVCADDFGVTGAVDAGILPLAGAGRLTAVSCLATGPAFREDGPALAATGASTGLHLDLTEGLDGGPRSGLGGFIVRSYLRLLDPRALRARLVEQLGTFERVMGRPPAFLDGHRHVHQLPVVAAVVIEELTRRYGPRPPLVRVTVPRRWRGGKAALIAALGGRALRRGLERHGIPANTDFAGVFGLEPDAPYRRLVKGWLGSLEDGGLLMCHPGEPGEGALVATNATELAYLGSEAFEADCAGAGVVRVRVEALA